VTQAINDLPLATFASVDCIFIRTPHKKFLRIASEKFLIVRVGTGQLHPHRMSV
jgi:hypothetical protein